MRSIRVLPITTVHYSPFFSLLALAFTPRFHSCIIPPARTPPHPPPRLRSPLLRDMLQRIHLPAPTLSSLLRYRRRQCRKESPQPVSSRCRSMWPRLGSKTRRRSFKILSSSASSTAAKRPARSAASIPITSFCRLLAKRPPEIPMSAYRSCFCEYTSHGKAAPHQRRFHVNNDQTSSAVVTQAITTPKRRRPSLPSGMMDGTVGALRQGLDAAGFTDIAISPTPSIRQRLFNGPFRDAAVPLPHGDAVLPDDPPRPARGPPRSPPRHRARGDLIMVKRRPVPGHHTAATGLPSAHRRLSGQRRIRHIEAAARRAWIDRDRGPARIPHRHQARRG